MRRAINISTCTFILIAGVCAYGAPASHETGSEVAGLAPGIGRSLAAADHRALDNPNSISLPLASTAVEQPDFTGTWYLNREQSDDSMEKIQRAFPTGRSKSLGNIANLSRVVFRRAGAKKSKLEHLRQSLQNSLEDTEKLWINQGESDLKIQDSQGNVRSLFTDAHQYKQEVGNGDTIAVVTQWREDQIVTEAIMDFGSKLTETYILAPGGFQIIVTVRVEDKRLKEPINIRRVYDLHGQN
jgi:hypothetical protein